MASDPFKRSLGWPPIAAMLVAAILVGFVLPNPLRIPQQNPAAQAEYAPVPGDRDSEEQNNFGNTGLGTSSGVGSGGLGEGAAPTIPPPPPLLQYVPRQKPCVGNPPQQTEDPLSPPCVAFFSGDNGGATWQGVTKDEILVVYYNDFGVNGDMTGPYRPSDEQGDQTHYYYQYHVRTVKALLRFFQKRFQTYGRRVRLIAKSSGGGLHTPPPQRRGEAYQIAYEIKPFAVATLIENAQDFAPVMAEEGIPTFGWNEDVPANRYNQSAPFFWSFMPDQETENKYSAGFICRKLYERDARFTKDPALVGKKRKFGLLYPEGSKRGPYLVQLQALLRAEVMRQCGMEFDFIHQYDEPGQREAGTIMSRMKRENITTVLCYCIPQQSELTVPAMQNAATSIGYFPEWYWDYATAMDRALWQRQYGSSQHQGFGVSNLWRQPAFEKSYAYRAYLEEEPATHPNGRFNFELYHVFLNLFSAIQGAGPKLTPTSARDGMFSFRYNNPKNPWVPTGGYGVEAGPGPWTFVHTGMGFWWDPTGSPPGGKPGEGCIRVIQEGRRFTAETWPLGDADLFRAGDPCSQVTRIIPSDARGT